MTTVAFVDDLMDRSRIRAVAPDVRFVRAPADATDADVVVVDLVRHGSSIAAIRAATHGVVVAYGPHVDDAMLARAATDGADLVLPRSRFFRDPAAALTGHDPGTEPPQP